MKYISRSQTETKQIAAKIAAGLMGGETLALIGDLGAGKTAFTKGLAAALKIKQTITSPTFVLMKVYRTKKKDISVFVHVDAYRVEDARALSAIGLEDYINDPSAVVVIEWADRVKKIVPKGATVISFLHRGDDERVITVSKPAGKSRRTPRRQP